MVTGEQGAAGERDGPAKGHPDEAGESDDGRCRHGVRGAVQSDSGVLEADGLVVEDQDEGAAGRDHSEWLVRRVEDQDMRHGCLLGTPAARGSRRDERVIALRRDLPQCRLTPSYGATTPV
ncbi:hypothetical protein GCM10025734_58880 [Kitasatospora paranensis]